MATSNKVYEPHLRVEITTYGNIEAARAAQELINARLKQEGARSRVARRGRRLIGKVLETEVRAVSYVLASVDGVSMHRQDTIFGAGT